MPSSSKNEHKQSEPAGQSRMSTMDIDSGNAESRLLPMSVEGHSSVSADIGTIGAALAFSLDESDSDDSIHQFLCSDMAGACRDIQTNHDDSLEDDDEDNLFDNGSPYGITMTRPPSPNRAIAAVQFRAAVSEPTTTAAAAAAAAAAPPSQSSQRQGNAKKRQSECPSESEQDKECSSHDDEAWLCVDPETTAAAAAAAANKRRRLVTQPLGDATNRRPTSESTPPPPPPLLGRCMSEHCGLDVSSRRSAAAAMDTARIDKAIASIDSLNLIGNSQQGHSLPTVKELDFGIRYVTPGTVSRLLAGHFADRVASYAIVDCRYPYEYQGGHIRSAVNVYRPEELLDRLPLTGRPATTGGRVLIFHCEFSSERAPRLARLLRQRDRETNLLNYPKLHYPELYLLQGGYRAFYEGHKGDCDPASYTKMADPGHKQELAYFHRMGKAWERQNSRTKHSRLQSMIGSPLLM